LFSEADENGWLSKGVIGYERKVFQATKRHARQRTAEEVEWVGWTGETWDKNLFPDPIDLYQHHQSAEGSSISRTDLSST